LTLKCRRMRTRTIPVERNLSCASTILSFELVDSFSASYQSYVSGASGSEAILSVGVLYISSAWYAGSFWGGTSLPLTSDAVVLQICDLNRNKIYSGSTYTTDQAFWSSSWMIFCSSDPVKSVTGCRDAHLDALRTYTYMRTEASSSATLIKTELFRYALKNNYGSWTYIFEESRCTIWFASCVQKQSMHTRGWSA